MHKSEQDIWDLTKTKAKERDFSNIIDSELKTEVKKEIILICGRCSDKEKIEGILKEKRGEDIMNNISHSICNSCYDKQMETIEAVNDILNSKM